MSTLRGNSGDNIIESTSNADVLDGGDGTDTLSYESSAAGVTINLSANQASGGYAQGDVISNFENVIGSSSDDALTGTAGANRLEGGAGNDEFDAGFGDDYVDGGTGFDTVRIHGANTEFTEAVNGYGEVVITRISTGEIDRYLNVEQAQYDNIITDITVAKTIPDVSLDFMQSRGQPFQFDMAPMYYVKGSAGFGTFTYTATGLPEGLSINSQTGEITGLITDNIDSYQIEVIEANGITGELKCLQFNMAVFQAGNDVPTASSISTTASNQSAIVSFNIAGHFNDANNDSLSFSATGMPDGISMSSSGQISGTIDAETGLYKVVVTANDGNGGSVSRAFGWTVNEVPNVAPTVSLFNDISSTQNDVVEIGFESHFVDADGDTLIYNVGGLPDGVSYNESTGKIEGTVTGAATAYTVTVSADDSNGGVVSDSFVWTVAEEPNIAPTVSSFNDISSTQNDDVEIGFVSHFNDADGDTLTYDVNGLPNGVSFNSATGKIEGIVTGAASAYTVTVSANDGNGGLVSDSFVWTVTEVPNVAPTVSSFNDISSTQNDVVEVGFISHFNDADGDSLTYDVNGLPNGVSFNAATGKLIGTVTGAAASYTVTVSADDGNGGIVSDTFVWTVIAEPNDAPTVTLFDDISSTQNDVVEVGFVSHFNDADGDALQYDVNGLPDGVNYNAVTGKFEGTVTGVAKEYIVKVAADDGKGGNVSDTFVWTVTEVPNNAPEYLGFSLGTRSDKEPLSIEVDQYFSDPDGDDLLILVGGLPDGVLYDYLTGYITGTPDAGFAPYIQGDTPSYRSYEVEFTLIDEHEAETEFVRHIVIRQDTSPPTPTLSIDELTIQEDGAERGVVVRLSNAVDYDITLNWSINDESSSAFKGFDFTVPDGAPDITIYAGNTTGLIRLTGLADDVVEGLELIEFEFKPDNPDMVIDNGGHIVRLVDSAAADLSSGNELLNVLAFGMGYDSVLAAHEGLQELYSAGVKYVASLEFLGGVSVFGIGFGGSAGISIDLADLFGVTPEGFGQYDGNENGRVSIWLHNSLTFTFGFDPTDLSPVDAGFAIAFTPIVFDPVAADDREDINLAYSLGASLLGVGGEVGNSWGTSSGLEGFLDATASVSQSIFTLSVPLEENLGFELKVMPTDLFHVNIVTAGVGVKLGHTQNHAELDRDELIHGSMPKAIFSILNSEEGAFSVSDGMTGSQGDDKILGTSEDNQITGEGGNDALYGYGGDDLLFADGKETASILKLHGGTGEDMLIYGASELWKGFGGQDSDRYVIDMARIQDVHNGGYSTPEVEIFDAGGDDDVLLILTDREIDIEEHISFRIDSKGTLHVATANRTFFGYKDVFEIDLLNQDIEDNRIEEIWFITSNSDQTEFTLYEKTNLASITEYLDGGVSGTYLIGSTSGDPHLVTLDGVAYDFHAAGEYVLLRATNGTDFEIQSRMAPVKGSDSVTVNEAFALRVGGNDVMIDAANEMPLTVNGVETDIANLGYVEVGNDRIHRTNNSYTIVFAGDNDVINDGDSQVIIDVFDGRVDLTIMLDGGFAGVLEGLLGNANGNPDDDIFLADGTILDRPLSFGDLYGTYRDDWRVKTDEQSLFHYDDGESVEGFYLPDYPSNLVAITDFGAEDVANAQQIAENAGLSDGSVGYNNAVLDFLLTGDTSFVESAVDLSVIGTVAAEAEVPKNIEVSGDTAGDDVIIGNAGDDILRGNAGNDNISGGFGHDIIIGGVGNNILHGDGGADQVMTFSGANEISGGGGSDLLTGGIEADTISGGAGNDVIRGEPGDGFFGGADIITGDAGNDVLMGGGGSDTFAFKINDGDDIIGHFELSAVVYDAASGYSVSVNGTDFQMGIDQIQLTGFNNVDASNILSAISDGADGAVFSAEGTSITFFGLEASQFTVGDFLLL